MKKIIIISLFIFSLSWLNAQESSVYDFTGPFSEGLQRVELDGKWGFVDESGAVVIPIQYEYAEEFSEGLASVRLNGFYGYIDRENNNVILFKYDSGSRFMQGIATVILNGKEIFIDNQGNEYNSYEEINR